MWRWSHLPPKEPSRDRRCEVGGAICKEQVAGKLFSLTQGAIYHSTRGGRLLSLPPLVLLRWGRAGPCLFEVLSTAAASRNSSGVEWIHACSRLQPDIDVKTTLWLQ